MRQFVILLIIAMGLCFSCVQTAYRPKNFKGGYQDLRVAEDMFYLRVHGNAWTDKGKVREYFLHRAAELTLESGYQYFVLYEDEKATKPFLFFTVVPAKKNLAVVAITGSKHSNIGYLKMHREHPDPAVISYDAKLISDQMIERFAKGIRKNR